MGISKEELLSYKQGLCEQLTTIESENHSAEIDEKVAAYRQQLVEEFSKQVEVEKVKVECKIEAVNAIIDLCKDEEQPTLTETENVL